MSHFTTLVLLNNPNGDAVEDLVKEALEPFDENTEVPEYEKDCYCIGQVARKAAREAAEAKVGTFKSLRDSFWKDRPKDEPEEQQESAWQEHIKEYKEVEDSCFNNHPMKDKPDPTCDSDGCSGTGKFMATYNPKSKWDWWQVGGRWQGDFDKDYDPIQDERNWEECWVCAGTGMRNDALGKEARQKDPEYKCNGCRGEGKKVKYSLAPHNKGNIKPVSEILDYCPFAILTPDGEWHEKGEMGWWACVSDEKKDWPEVAAEILKKHQGCVAVLCDLHI